MNNVQITQSCGVKLLAWNSGYVNLWQISSLVADGWIGLDWVWVRENVSKIFFEYAVRACRQENEWDSLDARHLQENIFTKSHMIEKSIMNVSVITMNWKWFGGCTYCDSDI